MESNRSTAGAGYNRLPTGIPAVYGQAIQSMQRTPETLLRTQRSSATESRRDLSDPVMRAFGITSK